MVLDTHSVADPIEPLYDARIRGAALVATAAGLRAHLHAGCWVSPCAGSPARLMVAFPKEFEGAEIVTRGQAFAVSLVAREQADWLAAFLGGNHRIDAGNEALFLRTDSGIPVLAGGVAYFSCRLTRTVDLGDFLLAIGDVVAAEALHPGSPNLTVNEIVAQEDPRGSLEPRLPFHGFDYDPARLPPAPTHAGPVSAQRFEQVYAHREWGIFFVSTALSGRGHFHVGCWMMQVSHAPPRMAVAFKNSWEGATLVRAGAPFVMTLLAVDQAPLLRQFAASRQDPAQLAGELQAEGDGLFSLRHGVCKFRCRPESLEELGDDVVAIGPVDAAEWIRPRAPNMTDRVAWAAAGAHWVDPVEGFALPASSG